MSGKQHRVVGDVGQCVVKGVIHRCRVTARQIGSPAPFEKKGVAGYKCSFDKEALTSRCVPWCVQQIDGDVPDKDLVTGGVHLEVAVAYLGDLLHHLSLFGLNMNFRSPELEQLSDTFNCVTHH